MLLKSSPYGYLVEFEQHQDVFYVRKALDETTGEAKAEHVRAKYASKTDRINKASGDTTLCIQTPFEPLKISVSGEVFKRSLHLFRNNAV
jgi:hypothetical protein